jgi:L-2-hydroxycarboxylate dehydrogenase (NAD+)
MPEPGMAKPEKRRVAAQDLHRFAAAAFGAVGLPSEDAARVAELMVEADLIGADAHGIFRLPQYIRRIRGGAVNVRPTITVDRSAAATAIVDGDNGMGHLVMAKAAETAVALASESGVGWVGVRRSNHAGPAALYAAMPVEHGMVGLYSAVASANHMAPWGGGESLLGTNPLAIGIPVGDGPPLLLDIATTVVSYGTVKNAVLQGQALPQGWMVSRQDGRPLTDPAKVKEGILLPIGGHKGSGLAIALGLLAGTLNGAVFGRDVIDFNADDTSETNTGHFIVALDIARFIDPALFAREASRHLDDLRASSPLPNAGPVRLPGDMRVVRHAERERDGVPLPVPLITQFAALAAELGIVPLT